MYLFVTYGKKGMRGIQVRGLRIASCFKKNEVIFVNDGESEFIRNEGYQVLDYPFNQIIKQETIAEDIFEKIKPKKIIFSDLPTNRLSQSLILLEANKRKIPVIIFENYYSKRQFDERVYQNVLKMSDAMFLNSLSTFRHIENPNIINIPPFVIKPSTAQVDLWKKKLKIKDCQYIITIFAYNEKVVEVVNKIIKETKNEKNVKIIITGQVENKIIVEDNIIRMPFVDYKDISSIITLSDLVIGKMGYMQFLETLSLKKIFVSIGEQKGFRKYWIENNLKEFNFHFDQCEAPFINFIKTLINDKNKKRYLEERIVKLHDGSFFDQDNLRKMVESVKYTPKKMVKTVLIFYDRGDADELREVKKIIENNDFILPLIFYKNKTKIDHTLSSFHTQDDNAIIDSSFNLIFNLTNHSYHALAQIFPWYADFVQDFLEFIKKSDEVILYGEATKRYFTSIVKDLPAGKIRILP